MGILVSNARFILTLDTQRRVLRDSSIYIQDGKIVKVGKHEEVKRDYPNADTIIDASDSVVTPGLINCHGHSNSRLGRGLGDNMFLTNWANKRILPFSAQVGPEEAYLSTFTYALDCLKTGTTCMAEYGGGHMDQVLNAFEEIGIRAVVATPTVGYWAKGGTASPEYLDMLRKFVNEVKGRSSGRIYPSVSLPMSVGAAGWRMTKEFADENNMLIQTHISGSQDIINNFKEAHGKTHELEFLEECNAIGPNLVGVHANWVSDVEIDLIIKHNVKIVHCPTASATTALGQLHTGSLLKMLNKGIPVALASDGAANSNFLDMIRVAYMLIAHRDKNIDATLFPPEELLEMITRNGARALLLDDVIGSIEEGKAADLTLFDTKRHEWMPMHNPVSNLMMSASGATAKTVLVDGKVVVENGTLKTADEAEILVRAEKAAFDMAERAGLKKSIRSKWPIS